MKINLNFLFLLLLTVASVTHSQSSQIFFARHAKIIAIGEVVSVSKDTFKQSYIAGHDSGLPQSVVFRVEEILKGSHRENFLRTQVVFPVQYLEYEKPEQYEIKIGKRYIFMSQYWTPSEECKRGIEKRFEALDCYTTKKDLLILPLEGEIEAIKWMLRSDEPPVDVAKVTKTP